MRSLLFVPGDSERKYAKARDSAADVLILDLEDSVATASKQQARGSVRTMLQTPATRQARYVRINAMDTGLALADLAAVMPEGPDGIVLPKSTGGEDIRTLSAWLDAFEAASGVAHGQTRIIAIATETAASIFGLDTYKGASPRLHGLMWGAEDLAASVGALTNNENGAYTTPFMLARNLCLMAAAAADVLAIDAICADINNIERVAGEAFSARRDGFSAKAIIHPAHIEPVNRVFTPSDVEVENARRIISAFAADPQAGVISLDGRMLDRPHERAARKILAAAGQND